MFFFKIQWNFYFFLFQLHSVQYVQSLIIGSFYIAFSVYTDVANNKVNIYC